MRITILALVALAMTINGAQAQIAIVDTFAAQAFLDDVVAMAQSLLIAGPLAAIFATVMIKVLR